MRLDGKRLLDVGINLVILQGASHHEMERVVTSHMIMQKARDDFLLGLLSSSEYLELLDSHEINIDLYVDNLENNLNRVGIIV